MMTFKCNAEDAIRISTEQIRRLEKAIARLDNTDPEEVDADEYQDLLGQLVRAREALTAAEERKPS